MTRVLLVHQPVDGGVGRHVRDLADGLRERDHEVILCGPGAPGGALEGIDQRPLGLTRAVAPRQDAAAIADLARLTSELRPDVIHAHSSKAGAVARLARLSHPLVPVIYSPHLYAFAGYFERSAERRAYRIAERLLAPAASRVICVCEAEAQLARAIGPARRVRVVHNGVPPALEGPIDPRIAELASEGAPVVGALALLQRRKGLETLIEAVPALLARHPRARVAIAGDGPQLEQLRDLADRREVAHAVSFIGPSADPLSVLRGLDVFVLPSWAESFPYVILEAMSLGLAILATRVGGVGEAVLDGEDGTLLPARDPDALARGLIELLDDPDRRRRTGAHALKRQRELFTLDGMIERTEAVYDELTAR